MNSNRKSTLFGGHQKFLCGSDNPYGFAVFDTNGHLVEANPLFFTLCSQPLLPNLSTNLFQDFTLSSEAKQKIRASLFTSCIAMYAPTSSLQSGPPTCLRLEMAVIPFPAFSRIVVFVQPLSSRQEGMMLMQGLNTYQFITDNLEDIVFLQDQDFCIFYVNESVGRLLGHEQEDLMNRQSLTLYHPDERQLVKEALQDQTQNSQETSLEVRMRHREGHYIWFESRAKIFHTDNMRVLLTINRDISTRKQTEEQVKFMTFHDSLTGLFNRHYFEQEMNRVAEGRYHQMGMIICDVDCLKFINDTLGHKSGDQLIKAAGEAILSSFRASDMVARIGGDEFAVILPNADRKAMLHAVKRIKKNIKLYNSQHPELPLHLSIGYALTKTPPFDMQVLFKEADDSMYRNKLYNKQTHKSDVFHILLTIIDEREPGSEERRSKLAGNIQAMAQVLNIPAQDRDFLLLFAKVYNIGLLGLPQEITDKKAPLSKEEQSLLRKQAEIGYRIAQHTKQLEPIAEWIYLQHEWWNGQGYPFGLSGENIPLPSRIMAVARAYTAMTTIRAYRPSKSPAQALTELEKWAGIQFDPHLVKVFLHIQVNSQESDNEGT